MQSASSLLQSIQHGCCEDKASCGKQGYYLVVLNAYGLEKSYNRMSVVLLEGCKHVDIKFRE